MTSPGSHDGVTNLAPEDAFSVLGDETRLTILWTLGEADEPLEFGELRRRVGYETSGNFSYHLDKLAGPFIEKTEQGYDLRQRGQRVVEAAFSGVVTESPVIERTVIPWACPNCGADTTEVTYIEEQVGIFCPDCAGLKDGTDAGEPGRVPADQRRIGYVQLPPAGLRDRRPTEVLEAALIWTAGEIYQGANGVCPRCSASVDESVHACEDHDPTGGPCEQCGSEYGVSFRLSCSNCIYDIETALGVYLLTHPAVRRFMLEHDLDPVAPTSHRFWDLFQYEESIHSVAPVEAELTFSIDGDALTVTVDADLTVTEVRPTPASEAD